MFAFTKEQKQAKLARTNVENYNILAKKLMKPNSNALYREAISNAMKDIVDIFTLLRSSYDLSKPVKDLEDYRLLRVPGMPGIILNYKGYRDKSLIFPFDFFNRSIHTESDPLLQDYISKAIQLYKVEKELNYYDVLAKEFKVSAEFSIINYNSIRTLKSHYKPEDPRILVDQTFSSIICKQFAHNNNIDILIST